MSLAEKVRDKLQKLPQGRFISSKVLHELSPDNQLVDKAASRVYKTAGVKKLRNGLFYKPVQSKYFGELPPKEGELLQALKKQYKTHIGPTGELAAYDLGFTSELPESITYESSKRISPVEIGNNIIHFRKVDSKKLASANTRLFGILKALEYLCKTDGLKVKQRRRAKRLLNAFSDDQIKKALGSWPLWFQQEIKGIMAGSALQYFTGLSAFNIPWQGRQVDWHQSGMLNNNKFQIAGLNYESAPDLNENELFDCSEFIKKYQIKPDIQYCALPLRAIKDILYNNIMKKEQYPGFLKLDQYDLDLPRKTIVEAVQTLRLSANEKQNSLFDHWLTENGRTENGLD